MSKRIILIGFAVLVVAAMSVVDASAQRSDNKTVLTFQQPVEIPGHVLPAGTYTFKLADSMTDRHIVQVFNADGSKIIATLMAIPDYRLSTTSETVIKFKEVPAGSPDAIRAWFYPGNSVGQEFVYPKARALQLARAAKAVVPAVMVDVADIDVLKTAPIVAITADEKEVPVTMAIQTTPAARTATVPADQAAGQPRRELPRTAGNLPYVVLIGLAAITVALGLLVFVKTSSAAIG